MITEPMIEVIEGTYFRWTPNDLSIFEEIKERLTQAPVLALPYFDKTFEVECDAFGVNICGVLTQEGKPLAFFYEKLCDSISKYPTYNKEFYAIEHYLENWSHCLIANEFILQSDQATLKVHPRTTQIEFKARQVGRVSPVFSFYNQA